MKEKEIEKKKGKQMRNRRMEREADLQRRQGQRKKNIEKQKE